MAPELLQRFEAYSQALKRGKPLDREKLLAAFPQATEQLTSYLNALEFVHAAFDGEPSSPHAPQEPAAPAQRTLGDFVLLTEIGRGGMGVVYEAQQQSLERRVALKVLLGAGALTPRQRQRFHNEALAAASLDHPHIVKVYSVGYDQGVNYYAMQYIQGQSLAEVIRRLQQESAEGATDQPSTHPEAASRQLPPPDVRCRDHCLFVARLAIQAAEALEHAHRMGIIHRDIKPSNLLLDAKGQLWVTDFGLALSSTGLDLTLTGDIVGTFRYMSPEQALGRRHLLSEATDLYSLGSTLYELLALRPPFPEEDRRALLRLLADDDPPPVRRFNPAVPRDLETIVMKCLAKEPQGRYSSDKALAEDLQRFVEDRPILARRPSLPARLARWSRRHRSIVLSAAVLLGLVFVGLIAANWRIAQERNAARQAAQREREMAAVAEKERRIADQERRRAEANFQKAREAVDRGVRRAAEELAGQPRMEQVRRALLEDALQFYQGFLTQKTGDPVINHETALAYYQVGYIDVLLGQYQESLEPLQEACHLLEELVKRYPQEIRYRLDLAEPCNRLAYVLMCVRRYDEAISYRRKRLALFEQAHRECPDSLEYLRLTASAYSDLGVLLNAAGRSADGIGQFQRALALCEEERAAVPEAPEDLELLGHIHHWLGAALETAYRLTEAESHYRAAHQLRSQWLAEQPKDPSRQERLSHVKSYLASLLMKFGKVQEAEQLLREAVAIDEQLLGQYPDLADYRQRAGADYSLWGQVLAASEQPKEAEAALRRALVLQVALVADSPKVETYAGAAAMSRYVLGELLEVQGRSSEAAEVFRDGFRDLETGTVAHPEGSEFHLVLAHYLVNCPVVQFRDPARAVALLKGVTRREVQNVVYWGLLGLAQYRSGDAATALTSLETAMEISHGGDPRLWLVLAMVQWRLGDTSQSRTWYEKAAAWIDANHPTDRIYACLRTECESLMESNPQED